MKARGTKGATHRTRDRHACRERQIARMDKPVDYIVSRGAGEKAASIRDIYNEEDAFNLSKHYVGAYRARLNANLAFYDGLDGKVDWPLDQQGNHPLTELLLADFLVVD